MRAHTGCLVLHCLPRHIRDHVGTGMPYSALSAFTPLPITHASKPAPITAAS